jgi:hypothetical protein
VSLALCVVLSTACGPENPSGPSPTQTTSQRSPGVATFEVSGVVRDAITNAPVAGARAEISGAEIGQTSGPNGDFAWANVPAGTSVLRVSKEGYLQSEHTLTLTANTNVLLMLSPAASPPPSPSPSPSPSLYSGYVTDGQGRPVVGARVRGGPYFGYTDANGRYEFQGYSGASAGTVYPPDGYEPRPVRVYNTFPLYPGGQNITIRRITNVSMSPPATLAVGTHSWVFAQVSFDDGKTESPVADLFAMTSSDTGVVKVGGGNGQGPAFVEGVKAGIASVSGRYFGVSAAMFQVEVVR